MRSRILHRVVHSYRGYYCVRRPCHRLGRYRASTAVRARPEAPAVPPSRTAVGREKIAFEGVAEVGDERRSLVVDNVERYKRRDCERHSAGKALILRGAKAGVEARELFNLGFVQDLYYGVADR